MAFGLQASYFGGFIFWQDVTDHFIDTDLFGDGLGRSGIVARDHCYVQAHLMQPFNGFSTAFFDSICHSDDPDRFAVFGNIHRCFPFVSQLLGLLDQAIDGNVLFFQPFLVA